MYTNVHTKQPKYPSTLEWINTLTCSYNRIVYGMKMNETNYIQQCRYISKCWLKEIRLERRYKMGFRDTADDLFCVLGRSDTGIQFVTVHWHVHINGVQFSVYMLYIFNFIKKKWKKGEDFHFRPRQSYKNQIYPPTSNNNNKQTKTMKQRFSGK